MLTPYGRRPEGELYREGKQALKLMTAVFPEVVTMIRQADGTLAYSWSWNSSDGSFVPSEELSSLTEQFLRDPTRDYEQRHFPERATEKVLEGYQLRLDQLAIDLWLETLFVAANRIAGPAIILADVAEVTLEPDANSVVFINPKSPRLKREPSEALIFVDLLLHTETVSKKQKSTEFLLSRTLPGVADVLEEKKASPVEVPFTDSVKQKFVALERLICEGLLVSCRELRTRAQQRVDGLSPSPEGG